MGRICTADLDSLEFQELFDAHLTKFENNQILLYKIGNQAIYWVKHPQEVVAGNQLNYKT